MAAKCKPPEVVPAEIVQVDPGGEPQQGQRPIRFARSGEEGGVDGGGQGAAVGGPGLVEVKATGK